MSEGGNDSSARKSGIGARLLAARERADLSLVQAAELVHVDPNVLQALENERFGELGAPVYVRGHLRHYAELLKESVPELLALYAGSAHAGPPPDLTRMPHAKPVNTLRSALLSSGIAVVIGVGLIGSIRWIYLDLHPTAAAAVASIPAASAPATALDGALSADAVPTSAPGVLAAPVGAPASAPLPVVPPNSRSTKPARAVTDASITLRFKSACWTEVYDARGAQLFHAIGEADTVQTLRGPAPLKVLVGNFAVVDVEVDGQAQVIPMDAKTGRVAQFLVTHDGVLQPVQPATAAGNNT